MTMANAFTGGVDGLAVSDRALLARREQVMGPAYRLFYDRPLHLVRGEGVFVWDAEGRRYLDAYNNVPSVGHCHQRVADAIVRQASKLATHTRYLHEAPIALAERLLALMPPSLGNVLFCCSGSEANELAFRIATAATGGSGIIVTNYAYHGITTAAAAASPSLGGGSHPLVWRVPAPRTQGEQAGISFAEGVEAAIADMAHHGVRPAALIADTCFSSDGVITHPPGVLVDAVAAVRRAGGIFIADEVQAGFARLGSAFWGFARHEIAPDIVTLGKPMGNGYPVAATVARAELVAAFAEGTRYFSTFAGNPVACAAADATLDVIMDQELPTHAEAMGATLRDGANALAGAFAPVIAVRGAGLFLGVEIETAAAAAHIVNAMRDRGVLISAIGPEARVLKIRPPLVIEPALISFLLEMLEDCLARL
jgi:4-aminobutyrate aminotransferase-like enzyme